jgi:CubicO group peptidase (beta-lactamase class C family)
MPRLFITLALSLCWAVAVMLLCIAEEKFNPPPVTRGNITSLDEYLTARFSETLSSKNLGSGGYALLHQGQIVAQRGFGLANHETSTPVNIDSTLYLLSSLSKAVTAWGILKLVEAKKIGLDEPVLPYLKRWRLSHSCHLADS